MPTSIKEMQRFLRKDNLRFPFDRFVDIPREQWPDAPERAQRIGAKRSREYLVQIYAEAPGITRLSINRTQIDDAGRWLDGITWENLQAIKRHCGFGDRDAVEVFPADDSIVNVANMRHLFIFDSHLPYVWRKES
jgi:hypothetical protein